MFEKHIYRFTPMPQYKDWYPKEAAKLLLFSENYVQHIDEATALAKLPADTFVVSKINTNAYLSNHSQLATAEKEVARLRKLEAEYKRNMGTTVRSAGKQLRNTASIDPKVLALLELDTTTATPLAKVGAQAPTLVVSADLGFVKGRYTKHSHQGIDLYCCRTGEDEYTLLGRFNMSHWEDRRPNRTPTQPEQRDYYAVFVDRDQQVGAQSPTVSIVVGSRPG